MSVAPVTRAEQLKRPELQVVASSAAVAASWGEDAPELTLSSSLVSAAAASAEAARVLGERGGLRALDVVTLAGIHEGLEGTTIGIPYDGDLGIAGTVSFLVVSSRVSGDTTTLRGEVLL